MQKGWSRNWSWWSWVLWLHRLHLPAGKVAVSPSHMLQYGAAPLFKCLVGLQQKPELELCQTVPKNVRKPLLLCISENNPKNTIPYSDIRWLDKLISLKIECTCIFRRYIYIESQITSSQNEHQHTRWCT